MMSIKPQTLLVSAAALLALSACSPGEDTKSAATAANETPAATVNGTVISNGRVDMVVSQGAGAGQSNSPESRKVIVDQLIMQTLVAEEAAKKGLDKSPEVKEQLDVLKQSVLANAYVQDYIKNNPVGDDMLKAEYERIKGKITGNQYKARHILVENEAEAKSIIAKLKKNPQSFDMLAKEKSIDPGSKDRGGDLGWFDLNRMVPEFGAAVSSLGKGEITEEPVKTQFGYHIILLEDSKAIEAPPFDEVKSNLAQQAQQQNLKKLLDELKAKAKIEIAGAPATETPAPAK